MKLPLSALLILSLAAAHTGAEEAARPFVFTTVAPTEERGWVAHYDAGYSERADATVAENGFEQRVGVQGRLGHGLTLLGRVGLVLDEGRNTGGTGEAELLKDVANWDGVRTSLGGGVRREAAGVTVLLARVAVGKNFLRSALWSNLRLERPLASGRDAIDLITSIGWTRRLGRSLHAGVEVLGEDLEGFWEPEEAEGGARLFVGPSLRLAPPQRRWQVSLAAGPVIRASRSPRQSEAGRALEARDGYAARASFGYTF
jgi:hypothetical protein